jgi:hypothetical protein
MLPRIAIETLGRLTSKYARVGNICQRNRYGMVAGTISLVAKSYRSKLRNENGRPRNAKRAHTIGGTVAMMRFVLIAALMIAGVGAAPVLALSSVV